MPFASPRQQQTALPRGHNMLVSMHAPNIQPHIYHAQCQPYAAPALTYAVRSGQARHCAGSQTTEPRKRPLLGAFRVAL